MRNVGGAIGIALAGQIVVTREKLHASRIGESINPFSPQFHERIVSFVRLLNQGPVARPTALYGAAAAPLRERALGLIDKLVHREALLMAYSDAFLIAGASMLLCALGGLLLRSKRR